MKKIILLSSVTLLGIGIFAMVRATELPKAKFTVRVIGEDGKPIGAIPVEGMFGIPYNAFGGGVTKTHNTEMIVSNQHGYATFEGRTTISVGASISTKGYYMSLTHAPVREVQNGRWEPWNPVVEMVLRKVEKPIPMYAKRLQDFILPEYGKPIGYDFEIGDWTPPYGKGKVSDMILTGKLDRKNDMEYEYSMEIKFPNKGDGIQRFCLLENGSLFKSPRHAPEENYADRYRVTENRHPGSPPSGNRGNEKNRFYFLRTRTVLGPNGEIESARYTKIYGEFSTFTYFMNPNPNDRNMEYNGVSLLKNLGSMEHAVGP